MQSSACQAHVSIVLVQDQLMCVLRNDVCAAAGAYTPLPRQYLRQDLKCLQLQSQATTLAPQQQPPQWCLSLWSITLPSHCQRVKTVVS